MSLIAVVQFSLKTLHHLSIRRDASLNSTDRVSPSGQAGLLRNDGRAFNSPLSSC